MKKLLSVLLAALMAAALLPMGSLAVKTAELADVPVNPQAVVPTEPEREASGPDENEAVVLMVKLKDRPVAESVDEVNSVRAKDLTGVLKNKQAMVLKDIEALFPAGVECRVEFSYTLLFNGFAIEAPYYMMERIAEVEGVEKVFIGPTYSLPEAWDAEDTRLSTSVGLINADDAWAAGYTGAGSKIAILDTGCVLAHDAFSTMPVDQSMTPDTLRAALDHYDLHAEQQYEGDLSANTLYYSGKIPFRFNYDNGTTNVAHQYAYSDHGSHVAGIAAGNFSGSSYTGVAKDAQLVIMEVFNQLGGAKWSVILAAMEDCAYLEVDSLNMSLGSDMGFTTGGEEVDRVYELLSRHGVNVAVAAGNSGKTDKQYYGSAYKASLAMNPDNGVVSDPSTYFGSMSVASCGKSADPKLSDFSSWGTTADLRIKPEIAAPGENIYAPTDIMCYGSTHGYGNKSGTSMATPHIAGAIGLLTRYVEDNWHGISLEERSKMVDRLLMCTANPLFTSSGIPYSPRAQGAGEVDLLKAITTKAYITVEGCDRPKLEIGDDKDKTGVFTFSFNIVNFGSESLTYIVDPYVQSENASEDTLNGNTVYRMDCTPMDLGPNCGISCPRSVTVAPNSTETVTVTIELNDSVKAVLDTMYPHGAYVEGHVMLHGDVDLTVPFLGFYGNWNEASVFDRYTYIDEILGKPNLAYMSKQIIVGAVSENGTMLYGVNPYISTDDWLADRCTISPNEDGYYDLIDNVELAIIRNAAVCGIKIYNEDAPSLTYYDEAYPYMTKTWHFHNSAYYYATDDLAFRRWTPRGLGEGTHIVFKMYAYLDNPDFTPEQNECCELILPMTVDTTAPIITYWKVTDNNLTVRVYDEHYAAWIGVYSDPDCTSMITEAAITETERGMYTDLELKTEGHSTVYVKVGDYGRNTSETYELTGEGGSLTPVELTGVTVAPEETKVVIGQFESLTLSRQPAEAVDFDVEWSSSDESVATVVGGRFSAAVAGHTTGTVTITATATDRNTGAIYTDSAVVTVKNGYVYDCFAPANKVFPEEDKYLIGFKNGEDVYLLMNYNPNPIDPYGSYDWEPDYNYYCYEYDDDISYAIKAVLDDKGNVIGVDNSVYPNAELINTEWVFRRNSTGYDEGHDGYMIESAFQRWYYLKVAMFDYSCDLFPYNDATEIMHLYIDWHWDIDNHRLYYDTREDATKYVTYLPTAGDYEHFFIGSMTPSTVQLYVQSTAVAMLDTYTVKFVDWDGTVLSSQEVDPGGAAVAPEAPEREGYSFIGWDKDFSCVTGNMTVTARYEVNSYKLIIHYLFADGTQAAPVCTISVEYGAYYSVDSPVIPGYSADIRAVEGVMGADGAEYFVTYTARGLPGDVNCDGEVTFSDISLLAQYLAGQAELSPQGMLNADMNADGDITFADVGAIYQSIVG